MKAKRSQQEVMGLAIVVVLIILAVGFWLFFSSGQKDTAQYERQSNRLASYTNYAILDTTTDCRGKTIEELLSDCFEGGFIDCNGLTSCDYANRTIYDLLESTLGANENQMDIDLRESGLLGLNRNYIFMVCKDYSCRDRKSDVYINTVRRPSCPKGRAQSTPILISTGIGDFYYVVLQICL